MFVIFRCGHPKLQIRPTILISLECAGCHQCNGASPVCICCMVLEIQLFLFYAFQKVVAPCSRELGSHKSRGRTYFREPTVCTYVGTSHNKLDFEYRFQNLFTMQSSNNNSMYTNFRKGIHTTQSYTSIATVYQGQISYIIIQYIM